MGGRLLTVDEGDDVWMMKAFKDMDLRIEVILQLLVELLQVDRFDRYVSASSLRRIAGISKSPRRSRGRRKIN